MLGLFSCLIFCVWCLLCLCLVVLSGLRCLLVACYFIWFVCYLILFVGCIDSDGYYWLLCLSILVYCNSVVNVGYS